MEERSEDTELIECFVTWSYIVQRESKRKKAKVPPSRK